MVQQYTLINLSIYQFQILPSIIFSYVAIHEKVKEQIKGVDSLQFEEVTIFWIGMAEVSSFFYYYFYQFV